MYRRRQRRPPRTIRQRLLELEQRKLPSQHSQKMHRRQPHQSRLPSLPSRPSTAHPSMASRLSTWTIFPTISSAKSPAPTVRVLPTQQGYQVVALAVPAPTKSSTLKTATPSANLPTRPTPQAAAPLAPQHRPSPPAPSHPARQRVAPSLRLTKRCQRVSTPTRTLCLPTWRRSCWVSRPRTLKR